jgi:hypothetical protein
MDTPLELTSAKLGCGAYLEEPNPTVESIIPPDHVDLDQTESAAKDEDPEGYDLENPIAEVNSDPSCYEKTWGVIKRNKIVTIAGAIAVGSLAANPIGETIEAVRDVAPYVGTGLIISEAGWIGGAAMMLATGGKKMLNPLKIKTAFKDIADNAEDSKFFKAGFALNLSSAVAQFAIPTVAVTANMPPQTWGILAVGAIDLWATIVLRRAIWKGVHKKDKNS